MGTPVWDFGARGTLLGVTRGTGRAELVRAVLEGVAQRGADLLEAAEADSGMRVGALRVDGGMSDNEVFVSVPGRRHRPGRRGVAGAGGDDAGGGLPGRHGRGHLGGHRRDRLGRRCPGDSVEPTATETDRAARRARWLAARERALGTVPELSGIGF